MNQIRSAVLILCGTSIAAFADPQIPALEAINRVSAKHGARYIAKIVEMKGERGQAQPTEWELIVYDPASEYLLREFWIGDTRATNEGSNDDYYPKRQPAGFINLAKLKYGSVEAFRVLDREAERAKVGFDSIDYHLRCREFSDEPIWTLTANDADGHQVGRLDLSAHTGRVLRTVWSYRDGRRPPLIRDSALLRPPAPVVVPEEPGSPVRQVPEDDRVIGPARRTEPLVPAPIAPGEVIDPGSDPGTEVPEVVPIDPIDPEEPGRIPVPEEP